MMVMFMASQPRASRRCRLYVVAVAADGSQERKTWILLQHRSSTMKVLFFAALALADGIAQARSRAGAELFATHCAACHGDDGEGGGPRGRDR